ncbi:glycosyltransferase [Patescibacteria group bacterium]
MDLTIVIPAHNEAGRISPMLTSYIEHFQKRARILIVLNGCSDNTLDVVSTIIDSIGRQGIVDYLDIAEPIGKAGAVYEGFNKADTKWVGFVDADGSTPSFEFERLFHEINNADGVIASRRMPTSHVVYSRVRQLISWTFSQVTNRYLKLNYRDTQCGAKIFKTNAINDVMAKLKVKNNAFDVELLLVLKRAGYLVKEEPTFWIENKSSAMFGSPFKFISASWEMFKTVRDLAKQYKI